MRSAERSAYHGLVRVLLQSTHDPGTITLSVGPAAAGAAPSSPTSIVSADTGGVMAWAIAAGTISITSTAVDV